MLETSEALKLANEKIVLKENEMKGLQITIEEFKKKIENLEIYKATNEQLLIQLNEDLKCERDNNTIHVDQVKQEKQKIEDSLARQTVLEGQIKVMFYNLIIRAQVYLMF